MNQPQRQHNDFLQLKVMPSDVSSSDECLLIGWALFNCFSATHRLLEPIAASESFKSPNNSSLLPNQGRALWVYVVGTRRWNNSNAIERRKADKIVTGHCHSWCERTISLVPRLIFCSTSFLRALSPVFVLHCPFFRRIDSAVLAMRTRNVYRLRVVL